MKSLQNWVALMGIIAGVFLLSATNVSATRYDVQGLVFIDTNQNGVWDVGEAGYDGVWQWDEENELSRYVGTTVTVVTPAYDQFETETMPTRELEDHEEVFCTQQDLVLENDEINANPVRPCSGTWGLPVSADETYLQIWLTAPEGYTITSENPQYFLTGTDSKLVDFGIAPINGETAVSSSQTEETETIAGSTATYQIAVEGTGFVPGLVFIDSNEDGVWQPSEAGYGGQWAWDEDNEISRYVGTTVTLTSPAYDEFTVETTPFRELDEDETVACTQQDLVLADGELNPNPLRPCSGTWGLSHAGDDVYWVVTINVPDGYRLTSPNPQFYTTGSGQLPLDFGIVPLASAN